MTRTCAQAGTCIAQARRRRLLLLHPYFASPSCSLAGCVQVAVVDREKEVTARAGLQSMGASSGVGRGGVDRILRIVPGTGTDSPFGKGCLLDAELRGFSQLHF